MMQASTLSKTIDTGKKSPQLMMFLGVNVRHDSRRSGSGW
jgi:hypothetical protein